MAELTQDQARALADVFSKAAEAIGDYRFQNRATLSDEENLALKSLEQKLSNLSNDFTAQAISLTLDDLAPTLAKIVKVTNDAREAVEKLNEIRRVVSIAASLVQLGTAIASQNPGGILAAIESTKDSLAG